MAFAIGVAVNHIIAAASRNVLQGAAWAVIKVDVVIARGATNALISA